MSKKKFLFKVISRRSVMINLISSTLIVCVMMYFFQKEVMQSSVIYGDLSLQNAAADVELFIKENISVAHGISRSLGLELQHNINQRNRDRLVEYLDDIVQEHISLQSAYIIFEPNKFDGKDYKYKNTPYHNQTGRFLPCATRTGVEALQDYEHLNYYQIPKKTKKPYITNPYTYRENNKDIKIFSISFPLIINDEFLGVVGVSVNLDAVYQVANEILIYNGNSTVALLDAEGYYLTHSHKSDLIHKHLSIDTQDADVRMSFLKEGKMDHWFESNDGIIGCVTAPIHISKEQTPWQLQAKVAAKYVFVNAINAMYWIVFIIVFSIIGSILRIRYAIKKDLNPLLKLHEVSEKIAKGDLTQVINIHSNNEIGDLVVSFKSMVSKLTSFIENAQTSSEMINTASEQVSVSSSSLSTSANEQVSTTEEISATMEEISASLKGIASRSLSLKSESAQIREKINLVGEQAKITVQLQEDSMDLVTVLSSLAGDIKILALNAAVEAARAGEHGKGFAVVAKEVQKLSEKSTTIVKDISIKATESSQKAYEATEILMLVTKRIDAFHGQIESINDSVSEQSSGIEQITAGTQEFNNSTQQNAASAEELASTAEELNNQAEELYGLTKIFTI